MIAGSGISLSAMFALAVACSSIPGVPPLTESEPQVKADGLALLKPAEAVAGGRPFGFRLLLDHSNFAAYDHRNPGQIRPLGSILQVDQEGFIRAIDSAPGSPVIKLVKVECEFMESREENGDVYPCFRVRWIVGGPFGGRTRILEAFSFGLKYSDWALGAENRQELLVRGAAPAYQADTYKLAIALQKILVKGSDGG
jgi:hypothetical protein